jgi:ABC-type transporter lipoprotein component MlaA
MKIRKFDEGMDDMVDISTERVREILLVVSTLSSSSDDNYKIVQELYMELSKFKSKSSVSNDQLDDSVINLELLQSKLNDSLSIMKKIEELLESYAESGRKYLY